MLTTSLMYLQRNSNSSSTSSTSTSDRLDGRRLNNYYSNKNPRSKNAREKLNKQEDHLDMNTVVVDISLNSFPCAPKKTHAVHASNTSSASSQTTPTRSNASRISHLFSKKCALDVPSNADDDDINNKNNNNNKNKNNHINKNSTKIEQEFNQSRENSTRRHNLTVNNELNYENENSYSNREDQEYLENIPETNEINTNVPGDSFFIQADMKTPTPTEIGVETNEFKETPPPSTEDNQIPLVSTEERDLSIIRTKSGRHIFEPAFYQAQYFNGRPEYQRRYLYEKTLGNTLQGYICMAKDRANNGKVAIKVANKMHITKRMSTTGTYIAEDFVNEIDILKKISSRKPLHNGFAKWIDEWETAEQKYLAIEYCAGGDLFNYTQQVLHKYQPLKPKVTTVEARTRLMQNDAVYPRFLLIQNIFAQMVSVIVYLHKEMQMCHMDISLENFMIVNENKELKPVVKLIDFGVALDFSAEEGPSKFMSNKSVGKLKYQSPECYDCRHQELQRFYDCRLNDNYCLGVCLFMLLFAQHPYERPSSRSDYSCMKLLEQGIMPFLESHQYQYLVNKEAVHLLNHLLTPEPKRYFAEQITKHPFFNRIPTTKLSPMKK